MSMITISVRRADTGREYDFEVPSDQPIGEVAMAIVRVMGWDANRTWRVETPSHRAEGYLNDQSTLAQLNLWDGTLLTFQDHDPNRLIGKSEPTSQPGRNFIYIGGGV